MQTRMSLKFFLNESKNNPQRAKIHLRIIVNRQKAEIATSCSIPLTDYSGIMEKKRKSHFDPIDVSYDKLSSAFFKLGLTAEEVKAGFEKLLRFDLNILLYHWVYADFYSFIAKAAISKTARYEVMYDIFLITRGEYDERIAKLQRTLNYIVHLLEKIAGVRKPQPQPNKGMAIPKINQQTPGMPTTTFPDGPIM
jgi:hypothetical protein